MTPSVGMLAILVAVASLTLLSAPVESGGLSSFLGIRSKEWKWIEDFAKDEMTLEQINQYYEDNQATMEPKLREAFKLVVDLANVNPEKNGCNEPESMKVTRLFEALSIKMSAPAESSAKGVRKFAFDIRKDYGDFCANSYHDQLAAAILDKLDMRVKTMIEDFGGQYAYDRELTREDLFGSAAEVTFASLVTNTLMGRALLEGVRVWKDQYKRQMNPKTGKEEFNWVEMVEEVKRECKAYQGLVKEGLDTVSKDTVVVPAFAQLSYGWQVWRSWTATVACDNLEKFPTDKLAKSLASEAGKVRWSD